MTSMILSPALVAGAAQVEAAERAERRLALAVDRLRQVETDAFRLAEETSWRSRGGEGFRGAAERWCDDVAGGAAQVEALRYEVGAQASRLHEVSERG